MCLDVKQTECSGTWLGLDTTCATSPCTGVGACCYADGSCLEQTFANCSGRWLGSGATCTPNPCQPDCNTNGVNDLTDLATDYSSDCNGNGHPDECDIAYFQWSDDCDQDLIPDECQTMLGIPGLTGMYHDGPLFSGDDRGHIDTNIDHDWGYGAPWPQFGADTFSVRWRGYIDTHNYPTGYYTFYARTSDGVRVWVDTQLVIDQWIDQGVTEVSGSVLLRSGRWYYVVMEYYENIGEAVAELRWQPPGSFKQFIPQQRLWPTIDCAGDGIPDWCQFGISVSDVNNNFFDDWCEPGACCLPDGSCQEMMDHNCTHLAGGTWLGLDTFCDTGPCQSWCLGDANCSGGAPDFADVQYFIKALLGHQAWWTYFVDQHGGSIPSCPYELSDLDGGGVSFTDIAPFVNRLGAPCDPYQR
jgi:hypothetical protein